MAAALAAIAINVPFSNIIFGVDPEERRSEAIAAFFDLKLSLHRFSSNKKVRAELRKKYRQERMQHLHPKVAEEIAKYLQMTVSSFYAMLAEENVGDAFGYVYHATADPKTIKYGTSANWEWALIPVKTHSKILGDPENLSCPIWLVFWDVEHWFMEFMGNPNLHAPLLRAIPEFKNLPLSNLPQCHLSPWQTLNR